MNRTLDRRGFLLGGAALAAIGCGRRAPGGASEPAPAPVSGGWRELSFDPDPDAPDGERAMALIPEAAASAPLLVALHGRGEAGRGLDVGAGAWPRDYWLDRMHRRLQNPPLTAADLLDMVDPARLAALNASLAAAPYEGLSLACPYTPNLSDRSVEGARGFGRFVIDRLLPRLRTEAGAKAARAVTGIDGVSMGGRLSLFVGLTHPEVFGAVGALQPALRAEEAPMIVDLARQALAKAPVKLRLVTSEEDYFLEAVKATSEKLREAGVEHELFVARGNHGYEFNRGPGGAEMLLWHERVLRGMKAP